MSRSHLSCTVEDEIANQIRKIAEYENNKVSRVIARMLKEAIQNSKHPALNNTTNETTNEK